MIDNQLFTNSFSSLFMVVRVALNTNGNFQLSTSKVRVLINTFEHLQKTLGTLLAAAGFPFIELGNGGA